ncbi:MAG TPA: S-adenosylmethionine decarboxylase [Vicinamibacterales bacterium]
MEAYGCDPRLLRDIATLQAIFADLIADLDLHPRGDAQWIRFDGAGGVTGFRVLSESHVACHSFPEHGTLCLNLFCCRPRPDWDFSQHLRSRVGARTVNIRRLERPYREASGAAMPAQATRTGPVGHDE